MTTNRLRAVALATTGALISGLTVATVLGLAGPAAAAATPCAVPSSDSRAPGEADFDGDGRGDVAHGMSYLSTVKVEQSSRGLKTLTTADTGDSGVEAAMTGFGRIVRAQAVDDDACTDLVVSAPTAHDGEGRVYVVFGARTGIGTGRPALVISAPRPAQGQQFGAALDTIRRSTGALGNVYVAVGAPYTEVAGELHAGAVHLFGISDDDQLTVDRLWTWHQGAKGVGAAEWNDRFGEVVMTRLGNQGVEVVVGVPHEDVGKRADAGAIMIRSPHDKIVTFTQNTKRVPGTAEENDLFGAALAASGRTLAVGAPTENLRNAKDAGQVQLFTQRVDSRGNRVSASYTPGRALTLDTKHMAGKPHRGDQLGSSLAVLRGLERPKSVTVVAGIPRRTAGGKAMAGGVALFTTTAAACPKKAPVCGRVITQATPGVAGSPQEGARFGHSVGIDADLGPTENIERRDWLLVGAPLTVVGGKQVAGVVVRWRKSSSSLITEPGGANESSGFGRISPVRWISPSLYA